MRRFIPREVETINRKVIFKDTKRRRELTLPVTPESFSLSYGIKTETVAIHTMGDVALPGLPTFSPISIDCLFPAREYPFAALSSRYSTPYEYIQQFQDWIDAHTILRYIITGTGINWPVYVETIQYGEADGTNDVQATITLQRYRELRAIRTVTSQGTRSTADKPEQATTQTHTAVWGDTMWAIARKYYGDPTLCWNLADYNGKKNANILMVGEVIKIPPREALA